MVVGSVCGGGSGADGVAYHGFGVGEAVFGADRGGGIRLGGVGSELGHWPVIKGLWLSTGFSRLGWGA